MICKACETEFTPRRLPAKGYCSRDCWRKSSENRSHVTKEQIQRMRQGVEKFNSEHGSWNKGLKDWFGGEEKHPRWKGDKVGYHVLHRWVQKHLGKPNFCEHCFSRAEKRYEWANISGEYKRELDDWIRLCKKCHIKYDRDRGAWGAATAFIEGRT